MKRLVLVVLLAGAGYLAALQGTGAAAGEAAAVEVPPSPTQPAASQPGRLSSPGVRTDEEEYRNWVEKTRQAVKAGDWKTAQACAMVAIGIDRRIHPRPMPCPLIDEPPRPTATSDEP